MGPMASAIYTMAQWPETETQSQRGDGSCSVRLALVFAVSSAPTTPGLSKRIREPLSNPLLFCGSLS